MLLRARAPRRSQAPVLTRPARRALPARPACRGFDWDALAQRRLKAPYIPKVRVRGWGVGWGTRPGPGGTGVACRQ